MEIPKYDTLLEVDGWTFMREHRGLSDEREYVFIGHTTCPEGVQLEAVGDRKLPSVMHYYDHICQRCNQRPPEGLMGAYILYVWGTGAHV